MQGEVCSGCHAYFILFQSSCFLSMKVCYTAPSQILGSKARRKDRPFVPSFLFFTAKGESSVKSLLVRLCWDFFFSVKPFREKGTAQMLYSSCTDPECKFLTSGLIKKLYSQLNLLLSCWGGCVSWHCWPPTTFHSQYYLAYKSVMYIKTKKSISLGRRF